MNLITPLLLFVGSIGLLLYFVLSVYFGKIGRDFKFTLKTIFIPILLGSLVAVSLIFSPQQDLPLLETSPLRTVGNQTTLNTLISETNTRGRGFDFFVSTPGVAESTDLGTSTPQADNSFVDTNTQVEGIKEGDIVKTDGNFIYYASRFQTSIKVLNVSSSNEVTLLEDIDLNTDGEAIYTDSLYLTDDYLIVIGYRYDLTNSQCVSYDEAGDEIFCDTFRWWQPTGSLIIIDRASLNIVYTLTTDSAFIDHRLVPELNDQGDMISEKLLLIGHNYFYGSSTNQPTFTENGTTSLLSFDSMFFFEDDDIYGMTTFITVDIEMNQPLKHQATALLGTVVDYKKMYVNAESIYLAQSNYYWTNTYSYQTTTITQFDFDFEEGHIKYIGSGSVLGVAINQFALDAYLGYFRIATTETKWTYTLEDMFWSNENRVITNRLYILSLNEEKSFSLVSMINEGLGKPNESIMSVRFNQDTVYIVTFLRTDPLYIIDISDPKNPVITSEIELPGFDTYQHPWTDDKLIGIGYQADENGFTTGMKITAYDVGDNALEIETLNIPDYLDDTLSDSLETWSYSYSEALWDHRAILVSVKDNIFGFAVNAYSYGYNRDENTYDYAYHSYYFIFNIDFTRSNPLGTPVVIEHPSSDFDYVNVDRGVMINDVIHTLSNRQVVSYSLTEKRIIQITLLTKP
jgi:uncharacterized secreted protein with C-terminal beta-propeller domain